MVLLNDLLKELLDCVYFVGLWCQKLGTKAVDSVRAVACKLREEGGVANGVDDGE